MTGIGRVVTSDFPSDLVVRLDEVAGRISRSRSWIIRQALSEWLAEEQRRFELTFETLDNFDEGSTYSHEDALRIAAE